MKVTERRRMVQVFTERIPNPSWSRAPNGIYVSSTGFLPSQGKSLDLYPMMSAEFIPKLGGTTDRVGSP